MSDPLGRFTVSLSEPPHPQLFSLANDSPDQGAPPQSERMGANAISKDWLYRMGWMIKNVAQDYNISRPLMCLSTIPTLGRASGHDGA